MNFYGFYNVSLHLQVPISNKIFPKVSEGLKNDAYGKKVKNVDPRLFLVFSWEKMGVLGLYLLKCQKSLFLLFWLKKGQFPESFWSFFEFWLKMYEFW